jgi:hypothetical protein
MDARGICGMVPLLLYVLSVCAHAWMLVEVNPSRSTCTELAYETISVLALNIVLLGGGAFQGCSAGRDFMGNFTKYFFTIGLVAVAAVVLVLGSRLTLFAYQAHLICPANGSEIPADDVLRDEGRRSRAGAAAWFGILLLGAALLLQHGGIGCDDDGDDGDDGDGGKKYDNEDRDRFGRLTRRNFGAW